ncbi:MAG: hypothetical protein CL844_03615 [Crocinitomicaceae bacterium]|nr:hypothetical protein [Crocinitomicaceae bacterium]
MVAVSLTSCEVRVARAQILADRAMQLVARARNGARANGPACPPDADARLLRLRHGGRGRRAAHERQELQQAQERPAPKAAPAHRPATAAHAHGRGVARRVARQPATAAREHAGRHARARLQALQGEGRPRRLGEARLARDGARGGGLRDGERHDGLHRPERAGGRHGRVHLRAERARAPRADGRAAALGRVAPGQCGGRVRRLPAAVPRARTAAGARAERREHQPRPPRLQAGRGRALAAAL